MKRFSPSSEVAHLVAEVRRLNPEQVLETYGIEINDRGVVWDTLYEEEFLNLRQWAVFTVEQEHAEDNDDDYDSGYGEEEN